MINKIVGTIGVSLLLAASLSGCGLRPLPDEERYQYIDNVLESIDYKTVGDIVKEEIDDGDGVFAPSYKVVSYGNNGTFKELEERLRSLTDTCSGSQEIGQVHCYYAHTSVSIFYDRKIDVESNIESIISITDSSSGRDK